MEQEGAYLTLFRRVTRYAVMPDSLRLLDDAGTSLLEYVPAAGPTGGDGLDGAGLQQRARWGGLAARGDGNHGPLRGRTPLRIRRVQPVHGRLHPARRSDRDRPDGQHHDGLPRAPGRDGAEAAYLAALPTARTYRIEGDRLLLESASGARVASFVPAPAPGAGDGTCVLAAGGPEIPWRKVTFDLDQIDPAGLSGPPGGQVAVGYEFCIPATPAHLAEVQGIDPSVRAQPG